MFRGKFTLYKIPSDPIPILFCVSGKCVSCPFQHYFTPEGDSGLFLFNVLSMLDEVILDVLIAASLLHAGGNNVMYAFGYLSQGRLDCGMLGANDRKPPFFKGAWPIQGHRNFRRNRVG